MCHHPPLVFNRCGDLERRALRPGNVHSADEWRSVLAPVIARYRERGCALACAEKLIRRINAG